MIHLVYIPFRGVGIDNRNDEWFKERIEIFKNYTLKSLQNQTTLDFTLWLSFRPEDEGSPLIQDIKKAIHWVNLRVVFTYDGLMYHDDKFGGSIANKIYNTARILRRAWRNREIPTNPLLLFKDKNKTLPQRLANSLKTLEKALPKSDTILLTRIDSDDMFNKNALMRIKEIYEARESHAITCDFGYIFNIETRELAEYFPMTNPPFHTLAMPGGVFFNAERHVSFYRGYKSHEDIKAQKFSMSSIGDWMYCVTTHNPKNHISTTWNHPYRGRILTAEEKRVVLPSFGL